MSDHGVRKFIGIGGSHFCMGRRFITRYYKRKASKRNMIKKPKDRIMNVELGQRVFHIRRILSTLHRRKVQERRWSMFLCPEGERRVQSQRVGHGGCELLREPDRVVPCSAFGDESGSENTVGQ